MFEFLRSEVPSLMGCDPPASEALTRAPLRDGEGEGWQCNLHPSIPGSSAILGFKLLLSPPPLQLTVPPIPL